MKDYAGLGVVRCNAGDGRWRGGRQASRQALAPRLLQHQSSVEACDRAAPRLEESILLPHGHDEDRRRGRIRSRWLPLSESEGGGRRQPVRYACRSGSRLSRVPLRLHALLHHCVAENGVTCFATQRKNEVDCLVGCRSRSKRRRRRWRPAGQARRRSSRPRSTKAAEHRRCGTYVLVCWCAGRSGGSTRVGRTDGSGGSQVHGELPNSASGGHLAPHGQRPAPDGCDWGPLACTAQSMSRPALVALWEC